MRHNITTKLGWALLAVAGVVAAAYLFGTQAGPGVSDDAPAELADSENRAELRGYYRQEERGGSEMLDGETLTCDQFVIREGGEEFSQEYRSMIARGNTVNQLDPEGNLVLNLDLEQVNESRQAEIQATTQANPGVIELRKVDQGPGRGVGPCYSFVEIVDVPDNK